MPDRQFLLSRFACVLDFRDLRADRPARPATFRDLTVEDLKLGLEALQDPADPILEWEDVKRELLVHM